VSNDMRIGIMGGTFNPVHLGHLRTAEEIGELLDLDTVIFMPSAFPPHKDGDHIASFTHRLEMLRLAIKDNPHFFASDLEYQLGGRSYTLNTLKTLTIELGSKDELFYLLGYDSFLTIPKWYSYRDLFSLACFVVFPRPGQRDLAENKEQIMSVESIGSFLAENFDDNFVWSDEKSCYAHPSYKPIYFYQSSLLEISSTNLRMCLTKGLSVRYLVPDSVAAYIAENGLYLQKSAEKEGRLPLS
jgi:nicotinate-nucleotide adenylyltransferase